MRRATKGLRLWAVGWRHAGRESVEVFSDWEEALEFVRQASRLIKRRAQIWEL